METQALEDVGNADFLRQLVDYGDMARKTLLSRLPEGEPQAYLYQPIRDYVETSGKGLRPALLFATCKALGGRAEEAQTSAAVLELLHNAFLIHDDIEDVSDFRRGRPCMHKRLGVPIAINTGDAMQALALRMLRRNVSDLGAETAARIVGEFDHLLMESLEGQAIELGWIRDNVIDVAPQDYLRMTLKKTCWYSFIHPCRIGALIARPEAVVNGELDLDQFNEFGFFLGAAFQIQDDVLNLIGSQQTYGKEIGGDIYEGKRTLMLARLAGAAATSDRVILKRFLSKPRRDRTEEELRWVFSLMQSKQCIEHAKMAAQSLLDAAKVEFDRVFADADPAHRQFIAHFMNYMISRNV